ncbi:protein kinase [Pleurocapsales cyanobacterium LEGE 06147]|nr:protein kinase [Pleurocapsales cyanobacterium LEGE 06147]
MLGKLLRGHYRVIRVLAAGGFGKTYIAEDIDRPGHPMCVVKHLKPVSSEPNFLPIARRLFNTEAEVLEKLGNHDRIPRLLAYFEEDEEFYLVEDFIKGQPLITELPLGLCWSESQVIQLLQEILEILEFIHSYGVIHRDINPNNLIRRQEDEQLVLIDFGAIKQVRELGITSYPAFTQTTIAIGTQGYMPTEQVRGKPRLNSDIYALGTIAIQALTGLDPLKLQEDAEGELIWQERVRVSDELAAILTKMVRYHFKDRYQSVTEVLQALESLAARRYSTQPVSDNRQIKLEVVSKGELSGVVRKPSEAQVLPELTKVSLKLSSIPLSQAQKKVNVLSSPASLAPSANLKLSHANIFQSLQKSRLPIAVGIGYILVGIVTGYFYLVHRQSYLQAREALTQIDGLKAAAKYNECVQQAETFPADYSDLHAKAQTLLHECRQTQSEIRLSEAKKLAEQSRFKEAIALAAEVGADTNIYSEAQELMTLWSEKIFQIASNKYQQGNFKEAVAIATAIPAGISLNAEAREAIEQWKEELKNNETHLQAAQKALEERRWQDAIATAKKVSKTTYWQKQTKSIIQKARAKTAATKTSVSNKTYEPSSQSIPTRSRSVSTPSRESASYRKLDPLPVPTRSKSSPPYTKLDTLSAPNRPKSTPARSKSAPPYTKLDTLR